MKKISVKRFKPQQQSSKRFQTIQSQNSLTNNITKPTKNRFSCSDLKQNISKVSLFDHQSIRKNNFSQLIQFPNRQNLLRNMLQINERKRSQILNNLIKSKRKLFRTNNKNQQSFKKMIKIRTQQKQNYFTALKSDRNKTYSKNAQTTRNNSVQISRIHLNVQNLLSDRKKPAIKLSHRQSQMLKSSFNKRIKEIKLRKYFQKDQLQSSPQQFFQAYGASIKGSKHQQNQDSIFFSQGIYVLCDGHGSNGKQISTFIAQSVHHALNQVLEQNKIDQTIILETYRKIDHQLDNSNFDISFSGCTCIALLRYQNTLFCISLGDSKSIMVRGYNVSEISTSHKPDKASQKQRIQNYGGVVRPTQITKQKHVGPMRIWAPGKNSWGPGLAMSRAFGDKAAKKYGVISIPQVSQIKLTSDQQFIVLGSDGLFDYYSDQQICQFIRKQLKDESIGKQEISSLLVNQAKKKWPDDSSDDISCIIIYM